MGLAMGMACALGLLLAGCGGGDRVGLSGNKPSMPLSVVDSGEALGGDLATAPPVTAHPVSSVTPVPQVGSQAEASPSQRVYTEFDGEDIRVHVVTSRGLNGLSGWRSSVLHTKETFSRDSRLEDHSKRTWTLSGLPRNSARDPKIVVSARWHDDNAGDFLAGGWVDYGDSESIYYDSAFVDGPELRGDLPYSMSLPLKGQATYRGEAVGYYESFEEGEFVADATLWANFAQGTIEGCVGCQDGIRMTPTSLDPQYGTIERHESYTLDYLLELHPASFLDSFDALGTFNGELTVFSHPGFLDEGEDTACAPDDFECQFERTLRDRDQIRESEPSRKKVSVGSGDWKGRLSNANDNEGDPRLVGATLKGLFDYSHGDVAVGPGAAFAGYLIADSTAHGNRDVSDDERIVRESKRILRGSDDPSDLAYNRGAQAPVVDLGGTRYVGSNVVPTAETAERFTVGGFLGEVETSFGWVRDGTSAERMVEFLEPHMDGGESKAGEGYTWSLGYTGLPTYVQPPVVRLAAGTNDEFTQYAVRAVELINSALPYDLRIEVGSEPAPALAAIEDIPDGEIFVDFAATSEDWNLVNRDFRPGAAAINQPDLVWEWDAGQLRWEARAMRASHVWIDLERIRNTAWVRNPSTGEFEQTLLDGPVIDPEARVYSEEDVFSIVVHELLHALGFGAHNDGDKFPDSSLRDDFLLVTSRLPTIDSDALLAAYARLEAGAEPEELSPYSLAPWSDTSFHVRGDFDFPGGEVAFGVASRNGRNQPWVMGPSPSTYLADNPRLSGSATWNGALLGISSSSETVTGIARLNVDLASLDGQVDFTSMEQWGRNAAPGSPGSATRWGDGSLQYAIAVRGNTFTQTGGDEGEVTGSFLGGSHEAMGGVLERSDLSAGFGGTR